MSVGERLREARTRQNLSLRALGEKTGFSASFLSQVELGQTAPSLGSLQRITDALGLTVASVLGPERTTAPAAGGVVRRSSRGSLRSEWSKATVESLVQPEADEKLQAVLLRLEAGGRTGATTYARGRRLFAYCTSGAAMLVLVEPSEELNVQAGDSVVVEGPRTVAWENRESTPAEIVVVTAMVG
jgi:transcriptional regulator with XRE-family HTH domain